MDSDFLHWLPKRTEGSLDYTGFPKTVSWRLPKCTIKIYAAILMKYPSLCSKTSSLNVKIHYPKIGHTILELHVNLLGSYFEYTENRTKNIDTIFSKFQFRKVKRGIVKDPLFKRRNGVQSKEYKLVATVQVIISNYFNPLFK